MADTTIESLSLEISSNASNAVGGLDALAKSLNSLKSITKGGLGLKTVSNNIKGISDTLSSLQIDNSATEKIKACTGWAKQNAITCLRYHFGNFYSKIKICRNSCFSKIRLPCRF